MPASTLRDVQQAFARQIVPLLHLSGVAVTHSPLRSLELRTAVIGHDDLMEWSAIFDVFGIAYRQRVAVLKVLQRRPKKLSRNPTTTIRPTI